MYRHRRPIACAIAAAITLEGAEQGRCAGVPPHHTCPDNAEPSVAGRCRACQDAWNLYRKRVRRERHEAGLCTNCGEPDHRTRKGRVLCCCCAGRAQERGAARRRAKRRQEREDALFALLGTLRGKRQQWAFWVLRQLGYELDERAFLTMDSPEPPPVHHYDAARPVYTHPALGAPYQAAATAPVDPYLDVWLRMEQYNGPAPTLERYAALVDTDTPTVYINVAAMDEAGKL